MRTSPLGLALLLGALVAPALFAEESRKPHLDFRRSYAEALLEARVRNVPVLVTRHKDEWGRCERQYRSVLTDRKFVRWANEHVVVLVAHNQLLHDAVEEEGPDGERRRVCPLYPGLTCRDHLDIAVDVDNARDEDLVQVPFVELCPNTWLVLPTDEVTAIAEKDQFDPARIRKQVEMVQKELGKALPRATLETVRPILERAEEAELEEDYKALLEGLAGLEKIVPEPGQGLRGLVARRLEGVQETVLLEAEELFEAPTPTAEQRARARALLAQVDVAVYGEHLPVREALRAWLAKVERN